MNTPICDFLRKYCAESPVRLHMPGHKGSNFTGYEARDITEISGADSLYHANGIIAESERNASALYGSNTYYSTEGSTQCIKAMLYLVCLYAAERKQKPLVLAARNCHKAFLDAAVLLDFDVDWLVCEDSSYLSCNITANMLEKRLSEASCLPTAVYVTSPDYLGNMLDIKALSAVCRKFGVLLIVDNAHGAYLKFLPVDTHPITCGADICCDSAHKTLPVLTGGAYLHISKDSPLLEYEPKKSLGLFGSTSPSYLILESLDKANEYLSENFKTDLKKVVDFVGQTKEKLKSIGFTVLGDEPIKITVKATDFGYSGKQIEEYLKGNNIFCEFADRDFLVLMASAQTKPSDLECLERSLKSLPRLNPIKTDTVNISLPKRAISLRKAALSPSMLLKTKDCEGKILAGAKSLCPPAVAIAVGGEILDKNTIDILLHFGIEECDVIK